MLHVKCWEDCFRQHWQPRVSLGGSGCCGMSSFLGHSLKRILTVTTHLPGVSDFLWVTHDKRQSLCRSRSGRKDFQKHVWDEKARHTLKQDPVGSWADRVYRCTGSFLSCWSTCDWAHSVHSAPDTHRYLGTAQGTCSISSEGERRPSEQALWIVAGRWRASFLLPWMNLVISKLLQPQNGDRDTWWSFFPDCLKRIFLYVKGHQKMRAIKVDGEILRALWCLLYLGNTVHLSFIKQVIF